VDMAAILAEMQSMRAEMNAMHQAGAGAAVGATPTGGEAPVSANDEGGGVRSLEVLLSNIWTYEAGVVCL
jgi:hypothetical protein